MTTMSDLQKKYIYKRINKKYIKIKYINKKYIKNK